ncbi:hypothetical protein F2Q70_00043401 [Brassica cretica]|uniref:Uncharacterized protein n=2 Tax=Brassica cretica TaxID=69181 RepID=A0A3N6RT01_BRACR|nr:hypothetical protein F2Q70_00043401 [Brassica cretica]KAF2606967.1 hypothetical protein F2Q68_00044385 [Brassica cretica]KAF3521127.1 hypothetical protein DY000_02060479 [Brassica cretica]
MTEVNCLRLLGEFTSGVNVEVLEAEAFKQMESVSDLFIRVWMRPPALINLAEVVMMTEARELVPSNLAVWLRNQNYPFLGCTNFA